MENAKFKTSFKIITIFLTIIFTVFIFYGINVSVFGDKNSVIHYIYKFGVFAPVSFIALQIIQVIFPIIPGGVSSLAGVIAFGPFYGFIYNYIGISIGSVIAFLLARRYGLKIIEILFYNYNADKYLAHINNKKFNILFMVSILLPGLPDDLMCFIAGISKMEIKKFLLIIFLCKPLSLILYSLGFDLL